MDKQELYIPINVPESQANDYFMGFGSKELLVTFVSFIISSIIAVIIFINTDQVLYSAILGVGIVAITILIIQRDQFDESFIDKIKLVNKYFKSQKLYEYKYFNFYEENNNEKK